MTVINDHYTPNQIRGVLESLGVSICSQTYNDFLCLCPFHGNTYTPSMTVSTTKGLYLCFNDSCGESGNLKDLVKSLGHYNEFEAMRFIQACSDAEEPDFDKELENLLNSDPNKFIEFSQEKLDELHNCLKSNQGIRGKEYFHSRLIDDSDIDFFRLGFSVAQDMVTIPVHSPDGIPVGLVGRGVTDKKFKNSKNLPRSRTMFNLHRAKKNPTVVVTESAIDAIRVHHATGISVVATLGGNISLDNFSNLNRYFSTIIVMTDNDKLQIRKNCRKCHPLECSGHNPGREIGLSIANNLKNKRIMWAMYDEDVVYPRNQKDAGGLTDDEITQCIDNSMTHIEYISREW